MTPFSILLLALGCTEKIDDKGEDFDTIGGIQVPDSTSDGQCPDMTLSHTTSFSSSTEDRVVTVVVPDDPPADMPLVFFFHGLLDPGSTPVPTEYMASALNLQTFANDEGVMIVLPQSGTLERLGFEFFMWNVEDDESSDLVLFDDLRACAYNQLAIDLTRVHSMGFSGGALFSTVIAAQRSDVLASLVEMSGGSDINMLTFDVPLSRYTTPENTLPALLISGGADDQWPGGSMPALVNFSDATDTLQDQLVEDGHFVVRCEHNLGHTVPMSAFSTAKQWVAQHQYGMASPIESAGIETMSDFEDWCVVP